MNTIGIALMWCALQVTLVGLLASVLYVLMQRLRPAAAATVVLSGLMMVVILSLMVMSPWPRWAIRGPAPRPGATATGHVPSSAEPERVSNSAATPADAFPS